MKHDKARQLLKLLRLAMSKAKLPYSSQGWIDGRSSDVCGDLLVLRDPKVLKTSSSELIQKSVLISEELENVLGEDLALAIYLESARDRREYASNVAILTQKDLNHHHLTRDHTNRETVISFLNLVESRL